MTTEINPTDEWATLDELLGVESVVDPSAEQIGPVAFYGRCSTEDNQDPETSHGWQRGNAAKFIEPLGGELVAEFFDIGQSRSVPWERRRQASALLTALKNPNRGWNAVVVGEGTRCWFGNQFSLIAPRFAAYGVDLWVPELGGKYDQGNPSHKMLMSVLGGMSESERQHVQARVRAAMDAQVLNEGRHQGGRAPYGYVTVDGGAHPNPSKAAEGYRLRVLEVDEQTADVVRRIFAEYLEGRGYRAIAKGLNIDGIACPSASKPGQNRHRNGDGWQASTVAAIVDNPRYTGYAVFGRTSRQDMLLDPDDVAAGYVARFRRAEASTIVRSRKPAHPAIIDVATFTKAQLRRKEKTVAGLDSARRTERSGRTTKRTYTFHGRIRCAICGRKMEASPRRHAMYYRCPSRTLAPGSPVLAEHPGAVYLREDPVSKEVNQFLGDLFGPENVDETVRQLVAEQPKARADTDRQKAKERLEQAEAELRRYQQAIKAGMDPDGLVEAVNAAQHERASAQAALAHEPARSGLSETEVYAMIETLGDVGAALNNGKPERLKEIYNAVNLKMIYSPEANTADIIVDTPQVNNFSVGGGT